MKMINKIKQNYWIIRNRLHEVKIAYNAKKIRKLFHADVMSEEQTLDTVLKKGCSIARFGDGEFGIMLNQRDIGFQQASNRLADMLKEVIDSDKENLLICIPHTLNTVNGYKKEASLFWNNWLIHNWDSSIKLCQKKINKRYLFGDTQVTRPYMDWKTDSKAKTVFPLFREILNNRDILIVEGSQTCLGVGNDLLKNARTIKRIICPATNAFAFFDDIIDGVLKCYEGELVLLALGPTATVLAAKLTEYGIQALDIGHLDIEYEWYLMGAQKKCLIQGRYVNEVHGGSNVTVTLDNMEYQLQIIKRIGE